MAEQGKTTVEQNGNKLVLSRVFDAPRELVFSMFSNPEHLVKWWGPEQWPASIKTFEFRPGGTWHYCMTGPDGQQSWGKATFQEIDEPNLISFTDAFSNEAGDISPEMPQGLMTNTFTDTDDGKTLLTTHATYQSADEVSKLVEMGMVDGLNDTWRQLERLLADVQLQK